jgi:hypothetical protein
MNEPEIRPIRVFKRTIDFGIITMREDEFEAVLARFARAR